MISAVTIYAVIPPLVLLVNNSTMLKLSRLSLSFIFISLNIWLNTLGVFKLVD